MSLDLRNIFGIFGNKTLAAAASLAAAFALAGCAADSRYPSGTPNAVLRSVITRDTLPAREAAARGVSHGIMDPLRDARNVGMDLLREPLGVPQPVRQAPLAPPRRDPERN